jgi:hypothetical protein
MNDRNLLFSKNDLRSEFDMRSGQISYEISTCRSDYLLSIKLEDVCDHLVEKYTFEPPKIIPNQIELIEKGETLVQEEDYGRSVHLNGNYYIFAIPFTGNGNLFLFRASTYTYSPPCGKVCENEP